MWRDWRTYAGGGFVALLAWAVLAAPREIVRRVPGGASGDGPVRVPTGADLVAKPGRTYFATLQTNGTVNAAASVAGVKAKAEAEGFRDVVVSKVRIADWPGDVDGDYFVRGTFAGAEPKTFPRHVGVVLGSLNVLDVREA